MVDPGVFVHGLKAYLLHDRTHIVFDFGKPELQRVERSLLHVANLKVQMGPCRTS